VVLIDMDKRAFDRLHLSLAEDLRARTPAEVATIAQMHYTRQEVGRFEMGARAIHLSCTMTLVDRASKTIIATRSFDWGKPPARIPRNGSKEDVTGAAPYAGNHDFRDRTPLTSRLLNASERNPMNVYITCFTRSSVKQEARVFIEALRRHLPKALPAEFHRFENRKIEFTPENDEQFIELWRTSSMFWSRRKGGVYGFSMAGQEQRHREINHIFAASVAKDEEIYGFVAELGRKLRADYALAHSIPKKDIPPEDTSICGHLARMMPQGLPGVPWLGFYGKPYTKLIGAKKLMTLPFTNAEKVGKDSIICRVRCTLRDVWYDRASFEDHRARIAAKMGDVFYDSASSARRVPVFAIPIVRRPGGS
jgi:hypothetical protein